MSSQEPEKPSASQAQTGDVQQVQLTERQAEALDLEMDRIQWGTCYVGTDGKRIPPERMGHLRAVEATERYNAKNREDLGRKAEALKLFSED